ncbi:hypothetical protein COCCADRAFT_8163 [Bipolaris zeicola 26-R-13]|uniref:Uncharacterized protein n=1 Tax=Cochliobolus carbonum (strain 26-R-13) TaxID=930089 RepID=W6XWS4_COCC2|nr:uncharacterized protein COCCADRAFT_8163 [Bipolaris zeicola 26-R-13]EUC29660.1 hypothetical protein COCCADRAFT_8163 [Bipolaris zeicola 26-R-13]
MLLRLGSLSFELSMWSPVYAVAPFVLLSISIPLAFFALVTTSIAITLLSLRALAIYFRLAVAIVGAWLSPLPPSKHNPLRRSRPVPASARHSPKSVHQRSRRTSITGTASIQGPGAYSAQSTNFLQRKNNSLTALIGTSELTRDFEGVGGWRVAGDDDEEALWMGINSRLELPAETPTRRRRLSYTGTASPGQRLSIGSEILRMSPVQSRSRTPVRFVHDDEYGYFPQQPIPNNTRFSHSPDTAHERKRRKSTSASSTSSNTSTGLTIATKHAGEKF